METRVFSIEGELTITSVERFNKLKLIQPDNRRKDIVSELRNLIDEFGDAIDYTLYVIDLNKDKVLKKATGQLYAEYALTEYEDNPISHREHWLQVNGDNLYDYFLSHVGKQIKVSVEFNVRTV